MSENCTDTHIRILYWNTVIRRNSPYGVRHIAIASVLRGLSPFDWSMGVDFVHALQEELWKSTLVYGVLLWLLQN